MLFDRILPQLTMLARTRGVVGRDVISRVAAVSGVEIPQVTRWLEPDLLFSRPECCSLCRSKWQTHHVLKAKTPYTTCMYDSINSPPQREQQTTATHHKHTARLINQATRHIPPLHKPSHSQSCKTMHMHSAFSDRSARPSNVHGYGSVPCIA